MQKGDEERRGKRRGKQREGMVRERLIREEEKGEREGKKTARNNKLVEDVVNAQVCTDVASKALQILMQGVLVQTNCTYSIKS